MGSALRAEVDAPARAREGHGTESRDLQRRAGSGVGEGSLWDGLRALGGQKFFRPILDANFIS